MATLPWQRAGYNQATPVASSGGQPLWMNAVHGLKLVVRALCFVPFATGLADIVDGVGLLSVAGARLDSVAHDAVLNSQVGFWGAVWFGFGVVLWRASAHLRDEADLFRLLCGTLVLSGLARLGAAVVYGSPGPVLLVAMAVELVGGTGLLVWHAALLHRPRPTAGTPV